MSKFGQQYKTSMVKRGMCMAFVGGVRREDIKTHKNEDCFITSQICQTKSYTRQMTNFHTVIVHRCLHCAFTKNIYFSA